MVVKLGKYREQTKVSPSGKKSEIITKHQAGKNFLLGVVLNIHHYPHKNYRWNPLINLFPYEI
jgi:hypothetical protein